MRYLGVDFGLRRIGLAISEGQIASPFKVLEAVSLNDALVKIIQIIKAEKIDQIIVGMPEGKTGEAVKKFIKKLKEKSIDVIEADETLSTKQALSEMITSDIPRKKRKVTDTIAAAIILQNWLDGR